MAEPIPQKPWYKYWLLWAAMVPPAAAVIGGLVTAWLAGGPPDLVVDDYGEIALATQQRLERDQLARSLGLSAWLTVEPGRQPDTPATVLVRLSAEGKPYTRPVSLQLQVIHPTTAAKDQALELKRVDDHYAGRLHWPQTRYYLQLSDPASRWRLIGATRGGQRQLALQPASRGASAK